MGMEVIFPWQGMNEHPLNRFNCGGWGGLIWFVQSWPLCYVLFMRKMIPFLKKKKKKKQAFAS